MAGADVTSSAVLSAIASMGGPKSSSGEGGGTSSGVIWKSASGSGAKSVVWAAGAVWAGLVGDVAGAAGLGAVAVIVGVEGVGVGFAGLLVAGGGELGGAEVGSVLGVMPRRAIARSRALSSAI